MKKFLLIIFTLMFFSGNAYSDIDCSQIKKISKEYLTCFAKKTKEKTSNLGFDTNNIKEKKNISRLV